MVDAYYLGFSAFIQLAAGFCLAVIYINRNDDSNSLFAKVYKLVITAITENYFLKFLLHETKDINIHRKPLLYKIKALTIDFRNRFEAAVNISYICLVMTVSGIVSALFSIAWLYIIPFAAKCDDYIGNLYLTLCFSTLLASLVIVAYAILYNNMDRVKALILSVIFTLLFNFAGYWCLQKNIVITTDTDFNVLFNLSLIISYLPFVYYVFFILLNISLKIIILLYHNVFFGLLFCYSKFK